MVACPKCGFNLVEDEIECPRCGVIIAKARPSPSRSTVAAKPVLAARGAVMRYPLVESMNQISDAPLGDKYTVLLFDNIKSAGSVQYAFLLGVFDNATREPVYFVASEVNEMAAAIGDGSHFLGVFTGEIHANMGSSDDWGDPRKFFSKAIRLAEERFGVARD